MANRIKVMLAFDNRPRTKEERDQKVKEVMEKAFPSQSGDVNYKFLYNDALDILNQNMENLKKKQVRAMLIYRTN